jgi:hypothetical protein
MRTKTFDCLAMKDEAQLKRAERLRRLTDSERGAFYRHEHEILLQRQQQLKMHATGATGD